MDLSLCMDTKLLKDQLNIRTILNCKYTTPVAIISHTINNISCLILNIINIYVLDMFKTNQPKGNTMNKIRIFHKAFENEVSHVATMKMPTNKNLDQTLEYVFKRTQNLDEAWINDSIGFDMIPTVETRSTCVGDIFEVFENEKTVRSRYYVVMGKGFKYITPATFGLIAELKDNDLMQYFSNCHLSKDINSQTIKQINVA